MTLLSVQTTEHERPAYIGLTGISWGLGTVLGPIVGGALAQSPVTWRFAFYLNRRSAPCPSACRLTRIAVIIFWRLLARLPIPPSQFQSSSRCRGQSPTPAYRFHWDGSDHRRVHLWYHGHQLWRRNVQMELGPYHRPFHPLSPILHLLWLSAVLLHLHQRS